MRRVTVVAAALAVGVIGAACSSDDSNSSSTTTSAAPDSDAPGPVDLQFRPVLGCVGDDGSPGSALPADESTVLEGPEPCVNDDLPWYDLGPAAGCDEGADSCVDADIIASAVAEFTDGSGWVVNVEFTSEGSDAFGSLVAAPNVGERVAIVLDGVVQSAPVITPGIETSPPSVQITGNFTEDEANDLAARLSAGSATG